MFLIINEVLLLFVLINEMTQENNVLVEYDYSSMQSPCIMSSIMSSKVFAFITSPNPEKIIIIHLHMPCQSYLNIYTTSG